MVGDEFGTNMNSGNFVATDTGARSLVGSVVECTIWRQRGGNTEQECVAVGIGVGDLSAAEIGAGTAFVFNDELLAQDFRHFQPQEFGPLLGDFRKRLAG